MALLKIKDKDYRNESAVHNLIHYVLNADKMPSGCWGGQGIATDFPVESMYAIKKVYGQTTGKQAEHIILSFSEGEANNLSIEKVARVAYDICSYFENIQVLFAVHEKKDSDFWDDYIEGFLHIHFIVNTVNIKTGNKFWIDFSNKFSLCNYIQHILSEYNISETVQITRG